MTHLHSIIKNALLPVCLETTAKARQEEEKSVEIDALVDPVMTELSRYMQDGKRVAGIIGNDYIRFVANCLAIITRKPYLANAWRPEETKRRVHAPLTIVKPTETSTFLDKTMTLLVLHGGRQTAIANTGTEWNYHDNGYNIRLATDEEVEHFLDSLTPLAIRYILKNDLFAPMIEAMTQETELVVEKTEEVEKEPDGDGPAF